MLEIDDDELITMQKAGKRITTADGKRYFPRRQKPVESVPSTPEVIQAPHPQTSQEILSAMIGVLRSNEENISAIANTQTAMMSAIVEINKPKPKKRFHCPIVRDRSGVMVAVNVEEK
jgi:gamma-glutamyltranspeptidase